MPIRLSSTALAALLLLTSPLSAAPAFPGATGAGKSATGGRASNATVCRVTSLADSGAGTLRDCLMRTGPRYVVLRVGGTIVLNSPIVVNQGNVSLLGRRAPGHVQIRINPAATTNCRTPLVFKGAQTAPIQNVIVRDIRIRTGKCSTTQPQSVDALTYENGNLAMFDHLSLSWAMDENFNSYGNVNNYTLSYTISAEGLQTHSKGSLDCTDIGPTRPCLATHYRNLYASNRDRNPEITGGVNARMDAIDTVAYNGYSACIEAKESYDGGGSVIPSLNYLGNTCKGGRNTMSSMAQITFERITTEPGEAKVYAPEAQNQRMPSTRPYATAGTPFVSAPIGTLTATPSAPTTAYSAVIGPGGAGARTGDARDPMDTRIINSVINNTGKLIADPSEVGGYPVFTTVAPAADSDRDGLPNTWETQYGAQGPLDDKDGDGYPAIEEFENGTNPTVKN